MPNYDFGGVSYPQNNTQEPIPPGIYPATCVKCEQAWNQDGIEQWKITMEITDPRYLGRRAWDTMSWGSIKSEKANGHSLSRCKLILSRLGGLNMDDPGEKAYNPSQLLGKSCHIELEQVDQDWKTGAKLERPTSRITFAGYMTQEEAEPASKLKGEATPF